MKKETKRYVADTMVEAMERVRADLGEDAVIVRSSVIKPKSFLKWFKKSKVEVIAAKESSSSAFISMQQPVVDENRTLTKEVICELEEMKQMLKQMKQREVAAYYPPLLEKMSQHLLKVGVSEVVVNECCTNLFEQIKMTPEVNWTKEKIIAETKEYFFKHLSLSLIHI